MWRGNAQHKLARLRYVRATREETEAVHKANIRRLMDKDHRRGMHNTQPAAMLRINSSNTFMGLECISRCIRTTLVDFYD